MKTFTTTTSAFWLGLAVILSVPTGLVLADTNLPAPNFSGVDLPLSSTFFWFSSVELGVCYNPKVRVPTQKGLMWCTHQDEYDIDNNTWSLPQSCIALKPLSSILKTGIQNGCTNAGGIFNQIAPASSNTDATTAVNSIAQGAGTGAGAGAGTPTPDGTASAQGEQSSGNSLLKTFTFGLLGKRSF